MEQPGKAILPLSSLFSARQSKISSILVFFTCVHVSTHPGSHPAPTPMIHNGKPRWKSFRYMSTRSGNRGGGEKRQEKEGEREKNNRKPPTIPIPVWQLYVL